MIEAITSIFRPSEIDDIDPLYTPISSQKVSKPFPKLKDLYEVATPENALIQEPFAKLETALYEVPAPKSCLDIATIQWPKHLDEGISRHNLVPPQIESVYGFAKGSYIKTIRQSSATVTSSNGWSDGLSTIQEMEGTKDIPPILMQKLIDVCCALSDQPSVSYTTSWNTAHEIAQRLDRLGNTPWNTQIARAIILFIDYLFAHTRESLHAIFSFFSISSLENTALDTILAHFTHVYDNCWITFLRQDFFLKQKTADKSLDELPSDRSYIENAHRSEIHDIVHGGPYQNIPVGLCCYIKQYIQLIQHIDTAKTLYPHQEQKNLYHFRLQKETVRFTSLLESMETFFQN